MEVNFIRQSMALPVAMSAGKLIVCRHRIWHQCPGRVLNFQKCDFKMVQEHASASEAIVVRNLVALAPIPDNHDSMVMRYMHH